MDFHGLLMNQKDSLCLKTQPHLSLEVTYSVLFHNASVPGTSQSIVPCIHFHSKLKEWEIFFFIMDRVVN